MTAIAQKLDDRLTHWQPKVAEEVEHLVSEIIELADSNSLDFLRSRQVEQEVLDLIDADPPR